MAVMASHSPLDAMSLDQKPHAVALPDPKPVDTEMNGITTHDHPANEIAPAERLTNGDQPSPVDSKPQVDAPNSPIANATETNSAPDKETAPPEAAALVAQEPVEEPAVATTEPTITSTVPPPVEQPTSDLRNDTSTVPHPTTDDTAPAEIQGDQEMTDAPEEKPSVPEDDMDVSAPDTTEAAGGEELASQSSPQPTEEPAEVPDAPVEQETLPDAPVQPSVEELEEPIDTSEVPAAGQVRPREDDDEAEPSAKRMKTEEEQPASEQPPVFKVPEVPASSSQPPAPSTENTSAATPGLEGLGLAPTPNFDSEPITPQQKKHVMDAIKRSQKIKASVAFRMPVDVVALNIPTYPQIVTKPMDLHTMENKLKNDQYESVNAIADDMDQIVRNTVAFNGNQHPVTMDGMNLRAHFLKVLTTLPKRDAAASEKKKRPAAPPKPQPVRRESRAATAKSPPAKPVETHQPFVGPDGVPLIRRDSTAGNDRPKREIHPPKNRDLPYPVRPKKKKAVAELKFCQQVLTEMLRKRYSTFNYPFLQPVDPVALNIPNYFKVIKKPTDLSTIQKRLDTGEIGDARAFLAEVKLMFGNCYKFNPPEDGVHKMGKMLEEVFDKAWSGKDAFLAEQMRGSEPESPEPDSDADGEDEEDPESAKLQRMREIQEQIAALSQEAMQLTSQATHPQGQRKSPKVTGKKAKGGKASAAPKPKRANSMAAPVAAKPAAKKKKTFRRLTLDQKRYVSDAIGSLTETEMNKAVQIIRNGVPRLRDVHDDELELDIEEIPEDVVYTLYEFVKKLHPAEPDNDDDDYQEEAPVLKKPGPGGRKKNKPMSASEQDGKIAALERQLQQFNGSASEQSPEARHDESSDDGQSESSEEE